MQMAGPGDASNVSYLINDGARKINKRVEREADLAHDTQGCFRMQMLLCSQGCFHFLESDPPIMINPSDYFFSCKLQFKVLYRSSGPENIGGCNSWSWLRQKLK